MLAEPAQPNRHVFVSAVQCVHLHTHTQSEITHVHVHFSFIRFFFRDEHSMTECSWIYLVLCSMISFSFASCFIISFPFISLWLYVILCKQTTACVWLCEFVPILFFRWARVVMAFMSHFFSVRITKEHASAGSKRVIAALLLLVIIVHIVHFFFVSVFCLAHNLYRNTGHDSTIQKWWPFFVNSSRLASLIQRNSEWLQSSFIYNNHLNTL